MLEKHKVYFKSPQLNYDGKHHPKTKKKTLVDVIIQMPKIFANRLIVGVSQIENRWSVHHIVSIKTRKTYMIFVSSQS